MVKKLLSFFLLVVILIIGMNAADSFYQSDMHLDKDSRVIEKNLKDKNKKINAEKNILFNAVARRAPYNIEHLYQVLLNRPRFHTLPQNDFESLRKLFFREEIDSSVFYQCIDQEFYYLSEALSEVIARKVNKDDGSLFYTSHDLNVYKSYAREVPLYSQYRSEHFRFASQQTGHELPVYDKPNEVCELNSFVCPNTYESHSGIRLNTDTQQKIYNRYMESNFMVFVDEKGHRIKRDSFIAYYPAYKKSAQLSAMTLHISDSITYPILGKIDVPSFKKVPFTIKVHDGKFNVTNSLNPIPGIKIVNMYVDSEGYIKKEYYTQDFFKFTTIPLMLSIDISFEVTIAFNDKDSQYLSMPKIKIIDPPEKIVVIDKKGQKIPCEYMFSMNTLAMSIKIIRKTENGFRLSCFVQQNPRLELDSLSPNHIVTAQNGGVSLGLFPNYNPGYYIIQIDFDESLNPVKTIINPNRIEYKPYTL